MYIKGHTYRVDILNAEGLVCSQELSYDDCKQPQYFAMDIEPSDFYRVELVDVTSDYRIALGNPIWNARK